MNTSIDLVPLLPIKGNLAELFGLVQSTMIDDKPQGWKPHTKKYLEEDRPVRQGFADLKREERNQKKKMLIGLKVLNYGTGQNFVLSPGQTSGLAHFQDKRIQSCYIFLKACIRYLDLKLWSYQLKKLVLNSEMVEFSRSAKSDIKFLHAVISQQECRALFEEKGVDMARIASCPTETPFTLYFEKPEYLDIHRGKVMRSNTKKGAFFLKE